MIHELITIAGNIVTLDDKPATIDVLLPKPDCLILIELRVKSIDEPSLVVNTGVFFQTWQTRHSELFEIDPLTPAYSFVGDPRITARLLNEHNKIVLQLVGRARTSWAWDIQIRTLTI